MTEKQIHKIAFELNCQLVNEINSMNAENLGIQFGINSAILAEIKEELTDYFKTDEFPEIKILESKFSIFKYDSEKGFGIEAKLFTKNGRETELTLHTEFGNTKLKYKLIEVM
jgi:hypothetical protein